MKGRDLLKIGLKPGSVFTTILNLALNAKLDGQLKTKKEEITFAKDYAKKHKLID